MARAGGADAHSLYSNGGTALVAAWVSSHARGDVAIREILGAEGYDVRVFEGLLRGK